jgi:hypothetical protein
MDCSRKNGLFGGNWVCCNDSKDLLKYECVMAKLAPKAGQSFKNVVRIVTSAHASLEQMT